MHNIIFQPFLNDLFNTILSFGLIFVVLVTALSYPIKNKYVAILTMLAGCVITFYSHSQRLTDGFTIGLLVGLSMSVWGSVSFGANNAIQRNKENE